MKGDYTRLPEPGPQHFSRVLMQQGRVQLDSDWNASVELANQRERELIVDLVGPHGGSIHGGGFAIETKTSVELDRHERFLVPRESGLSFDDRQAFTLATRVRVNDAGDGGHIVSTMRLDQDRPGGYELGIDANHRPVFTRVEEFQEEEIVETIDEFGDVEIFVITERAFFRRRIVGSRRLPTDEFADLVVRYDGEAIEMYLNGELAACVRARGRSPRGHRRVRLGGFDGRLAHTRFWDYALPWEQIEELGRGGRGNAHGLLADYPVDETHGVVLHDRSGRDEERDAEYDERRCDHPPRWRRELWATQGRYYVEGLRCENRWNQALHFRHDGHVSPRFFVYLDAWERHVTALERPSIREVALPGDTTTRIEVASSVRIMPLGPWEEGWDPARWEPEASLEWRRLKARRQSGRGMRVRRQSNGQEVDNLLYRVEVHDGGVPRAWDPRWTSTAVILEGWDPDRLRATLPKASGDAAPWAVGDVVEAGSPDAPWYATVAEVVEAEAALDLTLHPHEVPGAGAAPKWIRRAPTFKWSRLNGSEAYGVEKIVGQEVALRPSHPEQIALQAGDWVEYETEATVSANERGPLYRVESVDEVRRTVRLQPHRLLPPSPEPHDRALLRRWDQRHGALPLSGVVPMRPGVWIPLENGIEIEFEPGGFQAPGNYWAFPVRQAPDYLQWPHPGGEAEYEPPHHEGHVYAPLALVELDESGQPHVRATYRRTFQALTERHERPERHHEYVLRSGDTITGDLKIEGRLEVDESVRVQGNALVEGGLHVERSGTFHRLRAEEFEFQLPPNSVGADQLQDGSVGASKLETDSIGTDQLRDLSVGNAQLQDQSVSWSKVAWPWDGFVELLEGALPGSPPPVLPAPISPPPAPSVEPWTPAAVPPPPQGCLIREHLGPVAGYRYVGSPLRLYPETPTDLSGDGSSQGLRAVAFGDSLLVLASSGAWIVDPKRGSVDAIAVPPVLRNGSALAASADAAYLVGGEGRGAANLLVYRKNANAWERGAPTPAPITTTSALVHGGRLYVVGGSDGRRPSNAVLAYDPEAGWQSLAPLALGRSELALASVPQGLLAVGGRRRSWYRNALVSAAEIYDPATDRWTPRAPTPHPVAGASLASVGERIYLTGGPRETSHPLFFNPDLNRWSEATELRIRPDACIVALGNTLYHVRWGPDSRPTADPLMRTFYLFEPEAG